MSTETSWWIALALGLLAAVVATALLQALYRQVLRIERATADIWQAGKQVAGSTAATWLIASTADRLDHVAAALGADRVEERT